MISTLPNKRYEMNYTHIYLNLINRASYKKHPKILMHHHHVIPVCMGGDDSIDNLVALTPSEHFVAHRLLAKMFPENKAIVFAFNEMNYGHRINNKIYNLICNNPPKKKLTDEQEFEIFKFKNRNNSTQAQRRMAAKIGEKVKINLQPYRDKHYQRTIIDRKLNQKYEYSEISRFRKKCHTT